MARPRDPEPGDDPPPPAGPRVSDRRAVADAYDAMAGSYDAIDDQPFYTSQYAVYARDLERRNGAWTGRVLDLGCGTGIHTVELAERTRFAVGVDVAPALLARARDKLAGRRGAVVLADAAALPFADGAFAAILSYGEPLSHVPDPAAAVAEIARVVEAGGRVVLSVDNEWNLRTLVHPARLWSAATTRGGSVRAWEFFDDDGDAVRLALRTFTHGGIVGLLERRGLAVDDAVGIHVFTLLAPLATDARGDGWRARLFGLLHEIDRRLAGRWPFNRFGYSKIVAATRRADAVSVADGRGRHAADRRPDASPAHAG